MKIKACNAFNAMFVDTVDTGVCGSMRCEKLSIRIVDTIDTDLSRTFQIPDEKPSV